MTVSRQRGFTLLELLVTIAVLSIVLTLAVPNFRAVIQNNRASTQANELVTALQLARSEAVKRGQPVSVCASDTSVEPPDVPVCGDDWTDGWIVKPDGSDVPLRIWPKTEGGTSIEVSDSKTLINYQQRGQLDGAVTMTITIPKCMRDQGREIEVLATGRVAVERKECGE